MRVVVRSEEGFSLLEVLFAAFIAFFILTAMFGLLVTSIREGKSANVQSIATNLANLAVEQARSIDYASVGIVNAPSGQPEGVLASQETTVYQNMTFTIGRTITWVDDPMNNSTPPSTDQLHDYKSLVVRVTWSKGGFVEMSTFIREHRDDAAANPLVYFTTQTVGPETATIPNGVVLFTTGGVTHMWAGDMAQPDVATGTLAPLQASASIVDTRGVIGLMQFLVDGTRVFWQSGASSPYYLSPVYNIDLTSVDSTGVPYFSEGFHVITVYGVSTAGGVGSDTRTIYVSNLGPDAVTAVTLSAPSTNAQRTAESARLTWTLGSGGADPSYYDFYAALNGAAFDTTPTSSQNTTLAAVPEDYWLYPYCFTGFNLLPFNAYRIQLVPKSMRGVPGTAASSNTTVTAPFISGNTDVVAQKVGSVWTYKYTQHISLSNAPGSPNSTYNGGALAAALGYSGGSVSYTLFEAGAYVSPELGGTTTARGSDQVAFPAWTTNNAPGQARYYQVQAQVKNSAGTVVSTIKSNVIGPSTSQTSNGVGVPIPAAP